MDSEKSSHQR
jgi:putative transposase